MEKTEGYKKVIVALDVPDLDSAIAMADKLTGHVGYMKVGKELFTAIGPQVITELCSRDISVFLDLKFHDIPNTVKGAAKSAARHGVSMFTIHASGGAEMIAAAAKGAAEGAAELGVEPPVILAVTVLTSIDQGIFNSVGFSGDVSDGVKRLAGLAKESGATGIVCSPVEIETVRKTVGNDMKVVTPGVRPAGSEKGDQKRVMTPAEAIKAGADYLVIGRPITKAEDPAAAARAIAEEIDGAL